MDKFHRHEALDRAYLLMENIDTYLLSHPYIASNEAYSRLSSQAFQKLHELYQLIGTEPFSISEESKSE